MSGHTPGPWHVPEYASWQIVDSRSLPGYTALAVTHDDKRRGRTKEQSEANARLIAASPELLEAANRVLHEIFMNSGAPDIESRTTEALGRLAEAAAKAEGRQ